MSVVKRFNRLIPTLILLNAFLTPAIADEVQIPSKPIATEQDDRDRLVYPILRNQLKAKIESAIKLASESGTVTTLETSSVTEIIGLIDRQMSLTNKNEIFFQAQADMYSKCASDVTLATTELRKCQQYFSQYTTQASFSKFDQRRFIADKKFFTSAQEQIDSTAANFWKSAADKAAADKAAADKAAADKAAADKAAADARAAAVKKTTIICVKGKLTKKVTAVKPKCPSGYKKN